MNNPSQNMLLSKAKKAISLIIAVILLVSTNAMPAFAREVADPPSPLPDYSGNGSSLTSTKTNIHHHFYGDQLSTSQEKELYKAMEEQLLGSSRTRTGYVPFSEPIYLDSSVSIDDSSKIETYAVTMLHRSLDAFRYDHPQFYWITGNSSLGDVAIKSSSDGSVSILGASANFEPAGIAPNDAANIKSVMDKIIVEAKKQPTAAYQIKTVHDMLAQEIVYSEQNPLPYRAFQITGAFVDQNGVCEAYSKAFKMICDRLGYRTVLVVGYGVHNGSKILHMWNYVQINGNWYAVDVTWDDQAILLHDYFLVGKSTPAPNFGSSSFRSNHIEEYTFNNINYKEFRYPQISNDRYYF